MYTSNQSPERDHGEKVVLEMRSLIGNARVFAPLLMKVRKRHLVLHGLDASLGQIQLEMVQTKGRCQLPKFDHDEKRLLTLHQARRSSKLS